MGMGASDTVKKTSKMSAEGTKTLATAEQFSAKYS